MVKLLNDAELAAMAGGYEEEWSDMKRWVVEHDPDLAGRDPATMTDGYLMTWFHNNVPELKAASQDGTIAFSIDGDLVDHRQMLAFLNDKYGK